MVLHQIYGTTLDMVGSRYQVLHQIASICLQDQYNILTAHNIILKNILIFLNKVHNYPSSLPYLVRHTISPDSPSPSSPSDYTSDWYTTYNRTPYNTSVFFKGPLLFSKIMTENNNIANTSINSYKRSIKLYLHTVQSSSNSEEWSADNFLLNCITGLRRSERIKDQPAVNYNL